MLPITALYASLLAALVMVLAALVVAIRKGAKIGLGDAGNQALQVRIRAHANALAQAAPAVGVHQLDQNGLQGDTVEWIFGSGHGAVRNRKWLRSLVQHSCFD